MANEPAAAPLIPISQAAKLLMISEERVRQLCKEGYIPRPAPGKTTLVGAVQGYIRFRDDADRRSTKSAADSRVRDARAAEIELRIAEKNRALIPVDEAVEAQDFLVGKVFQALAGIPARFTRDRETRRKLEAVCNAAQSEIAAAASAAGDAARTGKPLPDAGSSNDA